MTGAVRASFLLMSSFLLSFGLNAQEPRFSANEKAIINSIITQFKKECGHITILDEAKLKEIQDLYQVKKDELSQDVRNCYGEYLSQLVGTHNIHRETCDEVTPKKRFGKEKDLARLFINIKKYQSGIKAYHEKLNECLLRKSADPKDIVAFSDYEKNSRALSKKIREIETRAPFRENSVNYR